MDEKKMVLLIFGLVLLVALIGLILFYRSANTGELSIQLPVNIKPSKTTRQAPAKVVYARTSREPAEEEAKKEIKAVKTESMENCCIWKNTGMVFHISPPTVEYFKYPSAKVGSDELFSKSDLGFITKPYFYNTEGLCVKGGTSENTMAGTPLCIHSYKSIKLPAQAGLICYDGRWWLTGGICGELPVPDQTSAVPEL
ncbi:hypothetical protein KY310_03990 [Candidatus Woesearchaeota archaeon]|nr:hypothetical protein [Candidatus Woesearchaeota archaeon]